MSEYQFPPIRDRDHFPLLTAGGEMPCAHLMGCERLVFFAVEDLAAIPSVILKEGIEWHFYGDTRWPALSSWLEINTSPGGFSGYSGVLVMTYEIPDDEADTFGWIAHNGPLSQIFPEERSVAAIQQRLEMLRQQAASTKNEAEPADSKPRYIQSYSIYRARQSVRLIACYTDLLNSEGIPIPRYRMANVEPSDIEVCRFTLHSLFCLNQARLAGMKFIATPQLAICEPSYLLPGTINPPWALYHPLRVLRTRPAVRSIPTPGNLVDGVMQMETHEQIMAARRLESNLHTLAFELDARPRNGIFNDGDACMGAFSHRANGGAIYLLPNRLVEELDNTDCDEIRMKDIKLPFRNLFVKFTPPQPLFLAEGAPVDGCYIVKQEEEYLFLLTSHLVGVNYGQSLSVVCLDPTFSLHLPAPEFSLEKPAQDTDLCVNTSVELGIKDFLEKNAPPTENMSQDITRPDGTVAHMVDIRAESRRRRIEIFRSQEPVFRACLNIIVNAACFISFQPEDVTEEWDCEPPAWITEALNDNRNTRSARDRKQHALRTITEDDYTRIRICGKNLFAEAPHESGAGQGVSPRAHWRRGHWRRQRHGVGLSLVAVRWIRPTIVKKDNGPMVETRFYDVQDPPSSD